MPYTLDENGAVVWTDENVDAGPGGNQTNYAPQTQGTPYTDDIVSAIAGIPTPNLSGVGNQITNTVTATPPALTGQSGSAGVSASRSGIDFSPGGAFDQMSTKGMAGLKKDIVEGENKARAYGASLAAGRQEAFNAERAALGQLTDVEVARAAQNEKNIADEATMQKQMAIDSAADYERIQQGVAVKMADYQAAINELAASGINPGRAYSNLSGAQRGGILVTAFVTDFLGAKGVKTSGMQYIDQAIERDIQAQRDEIALKKDVAQGKMNIYQMFRQQGDSDYLAAEKTRGALFNAFKTEALGKLAAFDSPLAKARYAQAAATLDQKQLDITANIAKAVQDQANTEHGFALQANAQRLEGARIAESRAARIQQGKQWDAEHSGGVDLSEIGKRVVRDIDGKVIGTVSAGSESRVGELQDRFQNYQTLQRQLNTLAGKIKAVYDGPGERFVKDSKAARYTAEYQDLLYKIAKANDPGGRGLSDYDLRMAAKSVPLSTLTLGILSGDSSENIANAVLADKGMGTFQNLRDSVLSNVMKINNPDLLKALEGGISEGSLGRSEGYNAEAESTFKPKTASPRVDALVGDTEQWKNTDIAKTAKISDIPKDENQWKHAIDILGEDRLTGGINKSNPALGKVASAGIPVWLDNMEKVFNIALDVSPANESERAAAVDFLTRKANLQGPHRTPGGNVSGDYLIKPSAVDSDIAAAAQYYLMKLAESPVTK